MSEETNVRWERIQRLLNELRYEITRGMLDGEVDETLGMEFVVPISRELKNGVVYCQFRTRPTLSVPFLSREESRLRIVK